MSIIDNDLKYIVIVCVAKIKNHIFDLMHTPGGNFNKMLGHLFLCTNEFTYSKYYSPTILIQQWNTASTEPELCGQLRILQLYLVPVEIAPCGHPAQSQPPNLSGDQLMGMYTSAPGRALYSSEGPYFLLKWRTKCLSLYQLSSCQNALSLFEFGVSGW